jgi:cytochrome P450
MTETGISSLDRERIRELFDLRNNLNLNAGGFYTDDPYPVWHELRAKAAVHKGTVHELTGCPGDPMFHGLPFPERPHFSTFSYEVCDAAYRNPAVFASSPDAADGSPDDVGFAQSMLMMGGTKHRRYRTLVQPSFVPAKAQWWINNWIQETVDALVDGLAG